VKNSLPNIIVTGASGIVGRNFIESAKTYFYIYGIARRSQVEVHVQEHSNIRWIQVDIGNYQNLKQILDIHITKKVDFVLHLAGYYDFDNTENLEYTRTNINGTQNVLEYSKTLNVKRFIFASSVAASKFPGNNQVINEKSLLNANYPYAKSKKEGEILVKKYSEYFPCSVVRFAAVFTDWCEYGPLYIFLMTWLTKKWNSRILGGKGNSAIPYIHSSCLSQLLLKVFFETNRLPQYDVYIASPDSSISHKELFESSTGYFFGKRKKPILMPKLFAAAYLCCNDLFGRVIGKRPFEKMWMIKYIDKKLTIDSSYTREVLNWNSTPRFKILRRLLYIIETMKSNPHLFHSKNTSALKRSSQMDNYIIYEAMVKLKDEVNSKIEEVLLDTKKTNEFPNYQAANLDYLNWDIGVFYQLLTASVRNRDRLILINYLRNILVPIRFKEGFESPEVCNAILEAGKIIITILLKETTLGGMRQAVYDNIAMTIQLAVDEVENAFEMLSTTSYISRVPLRADIEQKLKDLVTFYNDSENEKTFKPQK
jgi:nucleoside-diphosphate-sugar epimerase